MRTVIDHNGCATYPNGNPSFDVIVPTTLQGVDVLAALKALTERVAELELKLSATLSIVPKAPTAFIEAPKPTAVNVPAEVVSEPVQVAIEAPAVPAVVDSFEAEAPIAKQTKKSSK
jgi:hypothetical protein